MRGWEVSGTGRDRLLARREFRTACRVGSWANPAALASANPPSPAILRGLGRPAFRWIPPGPPHQDLGEDVPGVLAFPLQPQRAERLLQPRRRARPRGPLRAS